MLLFLFSFVYVVAVVWFVCCCFLGLFFVFVCWCNTTPASGKTDLPTRQRRLRPHLTSRVSEYFDLIFGLVLFFVQWRVALPRLCSDRKRLLNKTLYLLKKKASPTDSARRQPTEVGNQPAQARLLATVNSWRRGHELAPCLSAPVRK